MNRKLNPEYVIETLKAFLKEQGVTKVVVGISGGKDSTIVGKLMVECLGKENVMGVLMPNGVQSDIDVSHKVVDYLGIPYITVNINDSFSGLYGEMNSVLKEKGFEVTESSYINIAPRIRMTTLYAVAQSIGNGCRVAGTTNKSEEYIGWLTKWGDGACDFEPIVEYTVTELRELGVSLGIPKEFVYKIPIDGLADGSDEERIGFSYDQLDKYIATGTTGDVDIDEKIERMHAYSEHKRHLIPVCHYED